MKIATILGARPQFIKAAPVSRAIAEHNQHAQVVSLIREIIIHTGQHYDHNMSQVFFEEMEIPEPHINLGIGSGPHGKQTGEMLIRIEEVLQTEKPDWVLVYGDTNSTLAGALAAVKLHIPVAHVEAGLRSYNRDMPEEHNRVLTDHCADLLLCPSQTAVDNLIKEGIELGVHLVGDTMYDAVLQFSEIAKKRSTILQRLDLKPKGYLLATIHRPYNTDSPQALKEILSAFLALDEPVVFPVHPRTKAKIEALDFGSLPPTSNLKPIPPVGYLDMLTLEENAHMILTDSGGMQKEAYFFGIPCVTLRPETEWVETVEAGWNVLTGAENRKIQEAVLAFRPPAKHPPLYGDGNSARLCVQTLLTILRL
jgi:UDP-GlcNAc3NAcA epimerase